MSQCGLDVVSGGQLRLGVVKPNQHLALFQLNTFDFNTSAFQYL